MSGPCYDRFFVTNCNNEVFEKLNLTQELPPSSNTALKSPTPIKKISQCLPGISKPHSTCQVRNSTRNPTTPASRLRSRRSRGRIGLATPPRLRTAALCLQARVRFGHRGLSQKAWTLNSLTYIAHRNIPLRRSMVVTASKSHGSFMRGGIGPDMSPSEELGSPHAASVSL